MPKSNVLTWEVFLSSDKRDPWKERDKNVSSFAVDGDRGHTRGGVSMEGNTDFSRRPGIGNHQLVIITHLLQVALSLQHIDELFIWLAQSMEERLNIQLIQFWANQAYLNGVSAPKLRARARHNP